MKDSIEMSQAAADGIGRALQQDFLLVETPERMAWVSLILKRLDDRPEWFPRGKWSTIQHIERQLEECAWNAVQDFRNESC